MTLRDLRGIGERIEHGLKIGIRLEVQSYVCRSGEAEGLGRECTACSHYNAVCDKALDPLMHGRSTHAEITCYFKIRRACIGCECMKDGLIKAVEVLAWHNKDLKISFSRQVYKL